MTAKSTPNLRNGAKCNVIGGVHRGKSGIVRDIQTSKTGYVTITVVQSNGDRFKTLARTLWLLNDPKVRSHTASSAKRAPGANHRPRRAEELSRCEEVRDGGLCRAGNCLAVHGMTVFLGATQCHEGNPRATANRLTPRKADTSLVCVLPTTLTRSATTLSRSRERGATIEAERVTNYETAAQPPNSVPAK
jgi:hypothetical protein